MSRLQGGLFGLRKPSDLFCKAQKDVKDFFEAPTDYALFNLVCTLNHLRDWIEKNGSTYEDKIFCSELDGNPDFKIIKALCNNAKHFSDRGIMKRSDMFIGFICGFNGAGDRLDQKNYTVDGYDIRNIVSRVFTKYKEYFEVA